MKQYTFEDWLNNRFWDEKDILGRYVCNDSERYIHLVHLNKMTLETLNEIQEAQAKTYDYMVKCTLKSYEPNLKRWQKHSPNRVRSINSLKNRFERSIEKNQDLYHEVVLPRLHRGMKLGAKFMIPESYKNYRDGELLLSDACPISPYRVNKDYFDQADTDVDAAGCLTFPTYKQMRYLRMEISVLWLDKLTELKGAIEKGTDITKSNYTVNSIGLIDPTKIGILEDWEKNLRIDIEKWKSNKEIEYCAAFVNLLYENKFFIPHKLASAKAFTLSRYGVKIDSSLNKIRKTGKGGSEKLLSEKTAAIKRKATGKTYGVL